MFDKNAISKENLYYANYKKEKRLKDYYDEVERDKKAMDKLRDQIEQEKLYQIEKKNRIRQNQYEDYNNYLKQKYSTLPQYREKLNIKLGGEERNIKKTNYNEEMDNLCINPTTQKNVYPTTPMINYSEMGRNYQKGYSHGYNIITGEVYSSQNNVSGNNQVNNNKKVEQNEYNNSNSYNMAKKNENETKPNFNINISPEEYEEFLKFKQMKRQKELEEIQRDNYSDYINRNANSNEINQNANLPEYESAPRYNREEKGINYSSAQQRSEIPERDYQKEQYFNDRIKDNYNEELKNPYYQQKVPQYDNYLNKNRKENFHHEKEKDNFNQESLNTEKDNYYNPNNQREYLPNSQREIENSNAYLEKYYPDYYPRESEPISQNKNLKEQQLYPYPQPKENPNLENFEYQRQIEKRDQGNKDIPNDYPQKDINNKLTEYQMMLKQNNNDEIQFKNNISLADNRQLPISEEKNINYLNENEKYREFLKNNNNSINNNSISNNDNIKEIEKDKYMQFLLNKTKENKDNKEQQLNYSEYINKEQNYPNENKNYNNYNNYKEQMSNYPDVREQIQKDNNYYYNANQEKEKDYYNEKQSIPIQYNNYIAQNDYQNQLLRERERERFTQNNQDVPEQEYLSYQEQMERIKRQEQLEKQELEKDQNRNISLNEGGNINNKNAKEIIDEYNKNRAKNISSEDHIFKTNDLPPSTPPKYNDEPLSSKERKQIQQDYAKYLEWQINEKNARNPKTPYYKKYNPILDNDNKNVYGEGENPYQQIREKNNPMKDIPINPYSNKNYDINNKSNLGYNPISHLNYNYPQNK